MCTNIYVITHRRCSLPEDNLYRPLHAGSMLSEDFGYLRDDQGENISEKNRSYCELTGLYWLWKNEKISDIIGICHFRRYFFRDGSLLTERDITERMCNYDVIVPAASMTKEESVLNHYKVKHNLEDLLLCREIIRDQCPQYDPAFLLAVQSNLFTIGNMLITKKQIFDEYCEWLFPILFRVEQYVDITKRSDYQKRVFGFLAERLLRVWLLNQPLRIWEEQVRRVDEAFQIQAEISDI